MDDIIFDGECHAISEDYGYIAARIETETTQLKELQEKIDKQINKYAEYLVNNYKEKAISLLFDVLRSQVMGGGTPDDYVLIHRPPWIVNALAQYGTIVLKFKRAEKDNLLDKTQETTPDTSISPTISIPSKVI